MIASIMSYPAEISDTPIKKIIIQPTSSNYIRQTQNRQLNVHSNRGRNIENGSSIIKVLKKPAIKERTSKPKKYNSKVNILSTESNPIYFTRAKVNGSFRNSPITAIDTRKSHKLKLTQHE